MSIKDKNRVAGQGVQQGVIILIVIACFCGLGLLVHQYAKIEETNARNQLQNTILNQVNDLRAQLEHEINTTLNLTMGALVYVAENPDIQQEEFALLAHRIMQYAPYIRNIGLAKGNVISHIYPLVGNEAALGLRYLDNPNQRDAVLLAMESRQTVIAGPVKLVQGGQGLISRIPIFLNNAQQSYWGMTSVVVDVEAFLKKAGLSQSNNTMQLALRGKDAKGAEGDAFYGDSSLFADDRSVKINVQLPQGSWQLAAVPRASENNEITRAFTVRVVGFLGVFVVSLLLYALLSANFALGRAKRHAENANEHKSRFFTNMTHELRTPLTAIHGAIRLINSGALQTESEQAQSLLQSAERNCKRLIWIVNDILDLKKLESGKMEYQMAVQVVLPIVKEAIADVQPYASEFNIQIALQNNIDNEFQLCVDNMRLQQVIVNLLSNAVKFSPENSTIQVNLSIIDNKWRLEVSDEGEGVPGDKLDSIFSEFSQANVSNKKAVASTGLGLSISRHIISDHEGDIGCFNRLPSGATFFIELPLV